MEDLNRSQLILLVLLVTFVTSVATAIVTATLVNQAPSPITQTVGKVIEKTVQTIIPANADNQKNTSPPQTVVITQEDQITKIAADTSSAVVSVVATKDVPVIEQYYVNPFEGQDIPPELLPQFEIPQYRQNGTQKQEVSSGSGFFVSKDGMLLTNKHVVSDTEAEYTVILNDGRKLTAKVLARDPVYDIAILKVDGDNFNFIPLGDSQNIKVGQTAIAIGNTLGEFQNTVSEGIISGLNRSVVASDVGTGQSEQLDMLIQTDAAISPGNSGGPLLNLSGQVVGLNTAVAQGGENVGFALPINFAKKGIADVNEFGKIRYAFLGVSYTSINASVKEEKGLSVDYGVLITPGSDGVSVMKDSPADKAGLKEGDIILEFDGQKITKDNPLNRLIANKRVGDTVTLKVLRDGKEMDVSVTLDERPETV